MASPLFYKNMIILLQSRSDVYSGKLVFDENELLWIRDLKINVLRIEDYFRVINK